MSIATPHAAVGAAGPAVTATSLPWNSLIDLLAHRAALQPHALAAGELPQLEGIGRQLTYAELERRAQALAARLQAAGAKDERVLLVMDNCLEYVVAFFACGMAGAIGVTVHTPTRKKQIARLAHVAKDADARFVLSTKAIADRFQEALSELAEATWMLVEATAEGEGDAYAPHFPAGRDISYLQYTSGSTGTPRGAVITHANLVYQGEYMERVFSLNQSDRTLTWWPFFHDMGLIFGLLQPIYSGFPVLITQPATFVKYPERWLRAIAEHRITFSGGPDFCYALCAETVDPAALGDIDLSHWRIALNGAEPVRASTIDAFQAAFGPLGFAVETMCPGYGLAEATLCVTGTPRGTGPVRRLVAAGAFAGGEVTAPVGDEAAREVVASGRWLPDTVVRIVDPANRLALGPDRIGEIWVAGGSPAAGYWRNAAAGEGVFQQTLPGDPRRYLRTGDLGFVDTAGNLFITGRTKDLIVINGKNHHPSDLEVTAEAAHPALRPHFAAAFAVDYGDREGVVVAAEVRREAAEGLDVEAVGREVLRRLLAEHEIPVDEVVLLQQGQLPKTTSGKLQRAETRQLWQQGTLEAHGVVRRPGAAC